MSSLAQPFGWCDVKFWNEAEGMIFIQLRVSKTLRMGWAVHVARTWEKRNACEILVGKHER